LKGSGRATGQADQGLIAGIAVRRTGNAKP